MKYDLSKIEERFREKFASPICELNSESELEITEKLFFKPKHLHVPFGFIRYNLILLDERPVLHVRLKTRMDMGGVYLIADEGIRFYDMHDEKNKKAIRDIMKRRTRDVKVDCEICSELGMGHITCPKCGRPVFDFNYFRNLDRMEKKYGTRDFLRLSKEKLTFQEIITIRSFIERCDRHCGDNSTTDRCRADGTFANLKKRIDEIKKENQLSNDN